MSSSTSPPADFHLASPAGIAVSFGVFFVLAGLYSIGSAIYNLYFHPLAHIPGPFLARASSLPQILHLRDGSVTSWLQQLHEKYGDAVRVNPNEVSFISGETAWQDIYGFRVGKHKTGAYLKDKNWYAPPMNGVPSILIADEAAHSRGRRNLAHAFSEKALREQEGLIQGFVDLLVHQLNERVRDGEPSTDIMKWYNYTTFDIITDLTFGEPLYCLRDKDYHPWVDLILAAVKGSALLAVRRKSSMLQYFDRFQGAFKGNSDTIQKRLEFFRNVTQKVADRLENDTDRPDFMSHILRNQGSAEKALTREEIVSNSGLFMIAGSETTATILTGTTYLLLRNPEVHKKVVAEVRGRFTSQSEITFEAVNQLEYMIACLQEGLRYYPPVPTGFARAVPRGGDRISGHYIPEGTSVYISQHATSHSSRNFTDPDAYVPERWLGDKRYESDNQAAVQPFSFGPRNCLGKNLAYAEMRVILAKMLFSFDIELVDPTDDWLARNKVFTLWEKPALNVRLTPVVR